MFGKQKSFSAAVIGGKKSSSSFHNKLSFPRVFPALRIAVFQDRSTSEGRRSTGAVYPREIPRSVAGIYGPLYPPGTSDALMPDSTTLPSKKRKKKGILP